MITIFEEFQTKDWDDSYAITIKEDGKTIAGFHAHSLCECPEDATLGRDLSYAYDAVDFFKLGYEAGKAGKEVTFVRKDLAEDEDFSKVVKMARDAWDILYNTGIGGGMPIEEFFSEYGDKPCVDLDQLNGGTGI